MRASVVGGINLDVIAASEQPLRSADSCLGHVDMQAGGVGYNIACRLAESGISVAFHTVFGDDLFSPLLKDACRRAGLDVSQALHVHGPSCKYVCISDPAGDMALAVNEMAIMRFISPAWIDCTAGAISRDDVCVLDANLPEDVLIRAAERFHVPLVADPVSCAKAGKLKKIFSALDAFKPNLQEARFLTGEWSAPDCARALLASGIRKVFISLGADGVYYAETTKAGWIPATRPLEGCKTGAGDALCAGIAAALGRGADAESCARSGLLFAEKFIQKNGRIQPDE